MQNHSLLAFSRGGEQDFQYLRAQIERSARQNSTYEFENCALLPGCSPPSAGVGFWKDPGGYILFVRAPVTYCGGNPAARALFRSGRQAFGSFEELQHCLKSMGAAPAAAAPAPTPAPAPAPVPARTLTDPAQVRLPQREAPAIPDYRVLARELEEYVLGQREAVETVAFKLFTHVSKRSPARPLSLILHGPTGVGKSELCKHVAQVLNRHCGDDPYQTVWTDLNGFTEAHSAYRLTGAPPGYVGYDDSPILESAADHPRTVFLFDELEKAHPEVIKVFMAILDEGRCAARRELSGHRRELEFHHCIFLFTTNADLGQPRSAIGFAPGEEPGGAPGGAGAAALAERIFAADERGRRQLAANGCLREIAGRFGGFVGFRPMDDTFRVLVVAKQIAALALEYGLRLAYISPRIIQPIIDRTAGRGAFSARSHVGIIEGYLSPFFMEQAGRFPDGPLRLEGGMEDKRLIPAPPGG